jgi:hypothetical protein
VFEPACVYGQVIKTRRNDRVVRVDRRVVIGAARLQQALQSSEDSVKLNTAFARTAESHDQTGRTWVTERSVQARWRERLEDHLELLRCHYNFVRRHLALKFGREVKTPSWPGRVDEQSADFERDLLLEAVFSELEEYPIRTLRVDTTGHLCTFDARRLAPAA